MRRLILGTVAFALPLFTGLSTAAAAPPTVYVRPDGSDLCSGTQNLAFNITLQCAKRTIQKGVDTVQGRGTVKVAAGTYIENVIVGKSVSIIGAGIGKTIVIPALSNPNPCDNSSLCDGAASNMFLVRASNVWIGGLTINGDNPAKTGVTVAGVDIDARNGIIEDHTKGIYSGLNVRNVEIKNVYLRAINAASGGKSINISNNTISNVLGSEFSVAIFISEGSGTVSGNKISNTSDAISANYSFGIKMTDNVITNSGSGLHIDNNKPPGPGVLLDLIENNQVSNCTAGGFGVWLLTPHGNAVVNANTVTQCDVGFAVLGGGADSDVTFTANSATGTGATNTAGIVVTTDTFAFGNFDTGAAFTNNSVSGFDVGVYIDEADGKTASVYLDNQHVSNCTAGVENHADTTIVDSCVRLNNKGIVNAEGGSTTVHTSNISGNDTAGVENLDGLPMNAADNFWGNASGPAPTGSGDAVIGNVTFSPFLSTSPVVCDP
ncbi:MAG: hypothetical protein IPK82_04535 [Polyangiaceae bacterium]|nr:hypothetical protein [Polyangiaceae bacterium]